MSQSSRKVEDIIPILARDLLLKSKEISEKDMIALDDMPCLNLSSYLYRLAFIDAIKDCLRWGLLDIIEVCLWSWANSADNYQLDKTIKFTRKQILKLPDDEPLIPKSYRDGHSDQRTWSIEVRCNAERLREYITSYISDWINNKLYRTQTNIYKASKQLEIVALAILKLLKNYAPNNLLVAAVGDKKIDFFATILFLEHRGYVRILDIENIEQGKGLDSKSVVGVRLAIETLFFEEFGTATGAYPEDYLEYVIKQEDIENKRITYHYPDTLKFKGAEHQFNKNCLPYWLFYLAYNTQSYEVAVSELAERAGSKSDALEKGMKNLRDTLRKKFGFDEFESFISIEGGKVKIDKARFYFKPKKV